MFFFVCWLFAPWLMRASCPAPPLASMLGQVGRAWIAGLHGMLRVRLYVLAAAAPLYVLRMRWAPSCVRIVVELCERVMQAIAVRGRLQPDAESRGEPKDAPLPASRFPLPAACFLRPTLSPPSRMTRRAPNVCTGLSRHATTSSRRENSAAPLVTAQLVGAAASAVGWVRTLVWSK